MKYYAINGSPRKKNNTATVLAKALEGVVAAQPDAQTEMLHLYDYTYKGCISCCGVVRCRPPPHRQKRDDRRSGGDPKDNLKRTKTHEQSGRRDQPVV